jgi:signal transduction histidine kinase
MLADLDEMEAMIAATLAFARDDAAREPRAPVDIAAMIAGLAADFGATYSGPQRLIVHAGPTALKRAFANLLENAQAYAGESRVTLTETRPGITLTIDDDGPGIPESELERVFAPFYRVEGSRNRDTGGTGLGLAVARSALHAHGGDVKLTNRSGGGLRVTVTLPA